MFERELSENATPFYLETWWTNTQGEKQKPQVIEQDSEPPEAGRLWKKELELWPQEESWNLPLYSFQGACLRGNELCGVF